MSSAPTEPSSGASPAPSLFCLSAEHDVSVSPQCEAFIFDVATRRSPIPALSIWQPRAAPLQRTSFRLKLFNQSFRELCDVSTFTDGSLTAVFPTTPVFLTKETESIASITWELLMKSIDRLHKGELAQCSQLFMHISRLGRTRLVLVELYAFFRGHLSLAEFLMVETPVIGGDQLLEKVKSQVAALQASPEQQDKSGLADRIKGEEEELHRRQRELMQKWRNDTRAPIGGFRCTECGTRTTSQKRYVSLAMKEDTLLSDMQKRPTWARYAVQSVRTPLGEGGKELCR